MNRFQIRSSMLVIVLLTALVLSGCGEATSTSNQSPPNKTSWTTNPFTPNPTATPIPPPTPVPTPTPFSKPSESDARKLIENQIKTRSEGFIRLVSFEKTNGVDRVKDGTKMYELNYSAVIEFLDNCVWNLESFEAGRRSIPDPRMPADLLNPGWQFADKGARTKLNRKLMFELAEKGWRLVK